MIGSRSARLRRAAHGLFAGLSLLAVCAGPAAHAQVVVGAKAGFNVSNLSVTENGAAPAIPYESRTGLVAGATAALLVSPRVSLQLEGRYAQQGSQQVDQGLRAMIQLSYVEVPLVARVSILRADAPVKPRLHAGGFVRFETSCNVHISGSVSANLDCDTANLDGHKTADYGMLFGGGADLRLGPGAVTLDIEYAHGLRNLSGDPGIKGFSRVSGFAAGYRIRL